jgi:FXSXX-COOH protein
MQGGAEVAEQWKGEVGPGTDAGRAVLLPDLTDVDLRTLRAMDAPALLAAVDRVLCDADEFREVWYVGEDPTENATAPEEGRFPAGLAEALPGEESQG